MARDNKVLGSIRRCFGTHTSLPIIVLGGGGVAQPSSVIGVSGHYNGGTIAPRNILDSP